MADRFTSEVLALIGRDLLTQRLVKQVTVPNPAVGANFSVTVPGGVIWEPLAVCYTIAASAVVGTRLAGAQLLDADGNIIGIGVTNAGQAAGSNVPWVIGPSPGTATVAQQVGGLAVAQYVTLWPGCVVRSRVNGIDAGDQISGVSIIVREWDETAIMQEAMELFTGLEEYIESGYREGSE